MTKRVLVLSYWFYIALFCVCFPGTEADLNLSLPNWLYYIMGFGMIVFLFFILPIIFEASMQWSDEK